MSLPTLSLPDRLEAAVSSGHPWIYRDHLPRHELETGDWVRVEAGRAVAFGLYDASGAIGVRLFSQRGVPDDAWWSRAIRRAVKRRAPLVAAGHDAYRLLHGEGDGLPGLVADRYGRFAAIQPHTAALDAHLPRVARILAREVGLKGVVRRARDGVTPLVGEPPPPEETVRENGLRFLANLREGQKTALFLDHREHRAAVRDMSSELRVLNLFAYTGAFSVHALAGGAREAWSVDQAAPALRDAERNVALNGLPATAHHTLQGDVFALLPRLAREGRTFDLVILDPPSMARSKRQRGRALAAYRSLNEGAARLVAPNGWLASASCTAQVSPDAFEAALQDGLAAAGRTGEIHHRGGQPLDHPVRPAFPEGRYLKFVITRLDPT
ncbi:MAG: class I SAM-dependent rRNA methyltransferase [Trueperaceae bacterium]|nr:class I SAM-dependent rRNA methyltransferase [Trueperaceae bacterium]